MRVEIIGDCTLHLGDMRDIVPSLSAVRSTITDLPYIHEQESILEAAE